MASVLNILIICATLVAATSAYQIDPQLFQSILNPSPEACMRSPLLKSLGLCDRHANQQTGGRASEGTGAEAEAESEQEVEAEAEAEAEAEQEPAEVEAEQEVEHEAEAEAEGEAEAGEMEAEEEAGAEAEAEHEAEFEAETPRRGRPNRGHSLCGVYHFTCLSNKCIPNHMVCNGVDDCGDNSDESNCNFRRFM